VDEEELPKKPDCLKFTSANDVIKATNEAFGVNERLAKAVEKYESKKKEEEKEKAKSVEQSVKIRKDLQSLSQKLLDNVLAKEKAAQIKQMTESQEEKKERLIMEELIKVIYER